MSRFKSANDSKSAHINTLRAIIGVLVLFIFYILHGWSKAPEKITVDYPPDLRGWTSLPVGHKHPPNVYAFGLYIYQQLNNWPANGVDDYPMRINELGCYFTHDFKQLLETDLEKKRQQGTLGRTRQIMQIPGREYDNRRVMIESDSSWIAFFDLNLVETLKNETIKNLFAQYSIRIVRYHQNPTCNPFGLAIDGFLRRPARLEGFLQETELSDEN